MPVRRRKTLLLDLDGTLTDPAEGIIGSCVYALEQMGRPVTANEDFRWVIGPPLRATFAQLLNGRGDPEEALRHYRCRYSEWGLTQARVYDSILDVLLARQKMGHRLLLCTAKPAVFAKRVVDHFGLAEMLDGVFGPDLDGRFDDKGDLIGHIVEMEGLVPDDVCMVGDREQDVRAASRHSIPTVGVLWGYGSREELTTAGAAVLISAPTELLD